MKFKPGDICVIHSKTSHNNGKTVKVINYTNGKCKDILHVSDGTNSFNIKEESLEIASKYDLIRNMSDEELEKLLSKK